MKLAIEHLNLLLFGWITEPHFHPEPIELSFRKRIGTVKLDWVLRGDDEKR